MTLSLGKAKFIGCVEWSNFYSFEGTFNCKSCTKMLFFFQIKLFCLVSKQKIIKKPNNILMKSMSVGD